MTKRWRTIWITMALVGFIFLFYSSVFERWAFPIHYKDEIWRAAEQYEVDPYLIAAVIQTESKYRQQSISKKGAIGLMQIMPDTAQWILANMGYSEQSIQFIQEPALNIEVGSWYLAWLDHYYDHNQLAVIAAYNAGQGKVDQWVASGAWKPEGTELDSIPYQETRKYVKQVLYYYDRYLKVYGN